MHRRVTDDSGARVSRRVDEQSRRQISRSRPSATVRAAQRRLECLRLATALLVLAPMLAALKLTTLLMDPQAPESALLPTFLGVAVAVFVLVVPVVLGILWRGERGRCVRLRCCPACSYDMLGLAPRDGGLTICPECGAAWALEREEREQG